MQRVKSAAVTVEGKQVGAIGQGLLILLGVEEGDGPSDLDYMVRKTTNLRIFDDGEGVMNLSVKEAGGELLAVSQFTLLGDCQKGNRPSYIRAAGPEEAERQYRAFVEACRREGLTVAEGVFRAEMLVSLVNDGPVTILIDSKKRF